MTFNDNASIGTSDVSSGGSGGGGGGGMIPGGIATGGIGGVILLILMVLFGGDLTGSSGSGSGTTTSNTNQVAAGSDSIQQQLDQCKTGADANKNDLCLIKGTVASVENFWQSYLPDKTGKQYQPAMTKVFSGSMASGCGTASTAMGPFYCPTDRQVYIDAGFFNELTSKYGADGGQLAKEYVLAHEYGHHIQDELGLLGKAQQDPQGAESGSVRTELQADCFAGLWAHDAANTKDANGVTLIKPLTQSDINSALSAAAAVGDDRIQQQYQGRVTPESWTHGSSAARQYWFTQGYQTGDINACDTFNATDLHE